MSFYELQAPTAWADPPSTWSSTSLDDVEACPRRWQLLRSRWGDFERFPVRPHPAAIEGRSFTRRSTGSRAPAVSEATRRSAARSSRPP